jgi:hypothetical protein
MPANEMSSKQERERNPIIKITSFIFILPAAISEYSRIFVYL